MSKITFPIAGVQMVEHHLGALGDLNDNEQFINKLSLYVAHAERRVRLEEYFNHFIELYQNGDTYTLYITNEHNQGLDAYLLKGTSVKQLLAVVTLVRQSKQPHEVLQELYDYA